MSEELHNKLTELRQEVEQLKFNNPEDKDHLESLIGEIEKAEQQSEEENHPLVKNIKDAISRFETEHPRATGILNDIMVTLSNMGI